MKARSLFLTLTLTTLSAGSAFASCVVQDFEGEYFHLKNICSHPINLKYTFSESRQMAGAYTTLRPNQRTFDKARKNEGHKYYYCDSPEVPQSIRGDCVRQ